MQLIRKYQPFFVAASLLTTVVVILYPYLNCYVDPDATAYLTISQRYANGDFQKAINGYWSPWSCWLTALCIRMGMTAIAGAILANMLGAIGVAYVTQLFFLKYRVAQFAQWAMQLALAVFLAYAVYYQNFDDLWECFFLLYALRIIISHRFKYAPSLWLGAGVLGALAFFAKAYAFPYFIISTGLLVFYICRAWHRKFLLQWLKICAAVIGVMLLLSFPWLYVLHAKYGVWMTSTAGTLNMSWYLVGHPEWKEGIQYLIPPVYANSPTYWEDPWYANGATPHFWDSAALLARQALKMIYNCWKFIVSSMQLSVAFLIVYGYIARLLFRKIRRQKYRIYNPVIIAFLVFPLPFFLINFEARYIWYLLPLSMLLGVAVLNKNRWFNKKWVVVVFAFSYTVYPLWGISKMWNEGKAEYQLAQQFKQQDISGSIASNLVFGMKEGVAMQRLAYFSGNAYYIMPGAPQTFQELLPELRKHGLKYYCYYFGYNPDWKITDEKGNLFSEVARFKSFIVYRLYP